MKGSIIFLVVLFLSAQAMSTFLITEVFANGMGAGSNNNKSWIEVTLLSKETIIIEYLKISIITVKDKGDEIVEYVPAEAVKFSDRLILAENKNLGSTKCLSPQLPIIELPKLKIKNAREQKICLKLNEDETCVVLGKKDVFPDGVSLYRSLSDLGEHPHWFKEPCFIGEHMFASPGLRERFCEEPQEIFIECPSSVFKIFEPQPQEVPSIIIRHDNARVFVKLESQEGYPWKAHFCASSKPEGRLCHEIAQLIIVLAGEQEIKMPQWNQFFGRYGSLRFRDLMGRETIRHCVREGRSERFFLAQEAFM